MPSVENGRLKPGDAHPVPAGEGVIGIAPAILSFDGCPNDWKQNATATAQTKEAILETGIAIQVPGYLETGEKVKIDTREGRFVSRA